MYTLDAHGSIIIHFYAASAIYFQTNFCSFWDRKSLVKKVKETPFHYRHELSEIELKFFTIDFCFYVQLLLKDKV